MSDAYDALIKTGAIGSLKRDVLIGACEDIYYVSAIRNWFESASTETAKEATKCTVRLITELIARGLCQLATWGKDKGSIEIIEKSNDELIHLVDRYKSREVMPFDFFLTATDSGNEWLARYKKLASEL